MATPVRPQALRTTRSVCHRSRQPPDSTSMLRHSNEKPVLPSRTVILGPRGFVGGAIMHDLSGGQLLGLGRQELDLLAENASERLSSLLRPDDALVIVSAIAPCKTYGNMLDNVRMVASVCDALTRQPVAHLVYI